MSGIPEHYIIICAHRSSPGPFIHSNVRYLYYNVDLQSLAYQNILKVVKEQWSLDKTGISPTCNGLMDLYLDQIGILHLGG